MPIFLPRTFLSPETQNLYDALSSGFLEIPHYQRPYAWTKEQVRELWEDLLVTFHRSWTTPTHGGLVELVPDPRPHFYGPLFVERKTDDPKTLLVMDGQQRVVTFSVLIACLLEELDRFSDQERRNTLKNTLQGMLYTHELGGMRSRLVLGDKGSQDIYEELVCNRTTHDSREEYISKIPDTEARKAKALTDAYRLIRKQLHDWLETNNLNRDRYLDRLIETLLELSLFLSLKVENSGVAYEVFEGLNARGLELSQADLVKNKLLQRASDKGNSVLDHCAAEWAKATEAISDQSLIDMPTFLQLHYLVHEGPVRASELYDRIAETKLPKGESPKEYAESLRRSAERVQQAVDQGAALDRKAARDMESIVDVLKNRFALALVIATTEHIDDIGSPQFRSVVRLAHHFAFRRFVVEQAGLSTYSENVGEAARNFRKSGDVDALAAELRSKSTDGSFRVAFRHAAAKSNKIGFYVCQMIEDHRGMDAGISINRQSPRQHLEHIFPRNPREGWPEVESEEKDSHIYRYGNFLVLESDINAHISNKAYAYKKRNEAGLSYQESKLHMPRELEDFEVNGSWTLDSIQKRQSHLAEKFAVDVWDLSGS